MNENENQTENNDLQSVKSDNSEEKKNTVKKIATVICALLLLFLGVFIGVNWNKWFGKEQTPVKPDIDTNAQAWVDEQPISAPASSGIAIPGFGTLEMAAGQKQQQVKFYNPKQNTCYFVLTLIMPDGTEIWKSKMLPPGQAFYTIELTKPLATGTYKNAVLKYETYKMDDNLTPLNGAKTQFDIIVG